MLSEFSLILAMAGVAQGSLSPEFMTGAVIATLLSMMLTAYIIKYDEQLYAFFKPILAPIEHVFGLRGAEQHHKHEKHKPKIIIVGVNVVSAEAIELLAKKDLLIIEKNPKKLISYQERGLHTICSDVFNLDLYEELIDFSAVHTVASTIDDLSANTFLIRKVKHENKETLIIVTARMEEEGRKLYKYGASAVLVPDVTGRRTLAELLRAGKHEIHTAGALYFKELDKHFVYLRE